MITLSCTACNGTIARDIMLEAASPTTIVFKMAMKCPHCKVLNRIELSTAIVRTITINGRPLDQGTGEPRDEHSTIRTL